ncbi:hypothetical protein LMG26411_06456 [Cupriavidus numazuensis]|uniref:Uncharacterized protein n=2 Tax=Cupriavidus numazuensis TaxID=221992 RepID=A0ABM8TS49_9BURK|nr:hypothetical protein LMG26411_06456 [Cupriavidus numazuensis]
MTELDGELDSELRDALKSCELDFLRTILVRYREKGFDSESVYGLLEAMRNNVSDDIEDKILELMDIVAGFCAPGMRVW